MVSIEKSNKNFFKIRAYNTVIENLKHNFYDENVRINKFDDLNFIDGVGKGIKKRIEEIIENGSLEEVTNVNEQVEHETFFQSIHGFGPVKAKWIVENGARTIDDLRNENAEKKFKLNDSQKLGIKYHEEFEKRIPRSEMDEHNTYISHVLGMLEEPARYNIAGSYRRGQQDSGDIDVILTSVTEEQARKLFGSFIKRLKRNNYIIDVLAFGESKFMGVAKLPGSNQISRRLDIMVCSPQKYPFALLYFTGSQAFNIGMRKNALSLGYSLSEYGLKKVDGGDGQDVGSEAVHNDASKAMSKIKKERHIFDFLGIDYVKPIDRIKWKIVKE